MGFNSRDSELVVEEEVFGGDSKYSGYTWSSGVSWPPPNKVSGFPHFMALKTQQDEKQSKMKSNRVVAPGFVVKSGSNILEAGHQRQSVSIQNGLSEPSAHDVKKHLFPMADPFFKTHFPGSCQNFVITTIKQQFCGENPPTSHHPKLMSAVPVDATTEQCLKSKTSNTPAQLTIFYAGTVNVFDDISPEKAQAIVLSAGSGCIPNQVHVPTSKSPVANQELVNQPMNLSAGSGLPSPISVSSHPIDMSGGAAAKSKDDKVAIMIDMPNTLVNMVEPPRIVPSMGSSALTAMISSAIPQSRKASLARFLQKRNERASTAAPYNLVKKEFNGSTTQESIDFSDKSGVASSFTRTSKEIIGDI